MKIHVFTSICLLSVLASSEVTMETVVGVAGRLVSLPCRLETAKGRVGVCWGRGEPSLFSCSDTLIDTIGDKVTYRSSDRFSVSQSSSLLISDSRISDTGFYHCRVEVPGLFNDQISSVHLIIIQPARPVLTKTKTYKGKKTSSVLRTTTEAISHVNTVSQNNQEPTEDDTDHRHSDFTMPVVAMVQSQTQLHENTLQMFVGNTVRLSFIVFIPALILTAAYRVWRLKLKPKTDKKPDQPEEEQSSTV